MNYSLVKVTLKVMLLWGFFRSSEVDIFLFPSTLMNSMLIRDFTLVARLEFDKKSPIFDDRNFLIRIIPK